MFSLVPNCIDLGYLKILEICAGIADETINLASISKIRPVVNEIISFEYKNFQFLNLIRKCVCKKLSDFVTSKEIFF